MSDEKTAPEKGASQFEKAGARNASLARELLGFLGRNKKWWLLPILMVFLLVGVVAVLGGTAAAPFIYSFI